MIKSAPIKLFCYMTGFLLTCMISLSCTQCTQCDYYYVIPSTSDTITGGQNFCGSNRTVKDFESYYEEQVAEQAGLAGTTSVFNCLRSRKQ